MNNSLSRLTAVIQQYDGIGSKDQLAAIITDRFQLRRDRSVFECNDFALRFSSSISINFSNTVLSLSNLRKFDDRPFIVCVVTPSQNYCLLANTTFLKKISHSSQQLRENNIRGSFNGSDIVREFAGIANTPRNFARLFAIHAEIGFEGNLVRLVEATNNISPTGKHYAIDSSAMALILDAPQRAVEFVTSASYTALKADLDAKVEAYRPYILLAALIENVNLRGRVIEYLVAGEDERLRLEIVEALQSKNRMIPSFRTDRELGDYSKHFADYYTETDVKTKIMILNSNPKAYNIDKLLMFLSQPKSVFMVYFIGIEPGRMVATVLLSVFQKRLLEVTILLRHWSGRNSRGVTQFEGQVVHDLILHPSLEIDEGQCAEVLNQLMQL